MDQLAPYYSVAAKAAADFLKLKLTVGGHSVDMSSVIFALGAIQFLALSYKFLSSVTSTLTKPCFSRSVRSYGEWAVVTGATDGIGKAYAFEFAKKGLKVVIISRTLDRLNETATEIRAKVANATVEIVQADFSKGPEHGDYARIAKALANKQIGVLVNNVGCSYPSALFFHEVDTYAPGDAAKGVEPLTRQMVTMNITSVVEMTKIVLPGMVERKNGAIVNIASAAGRVPIGNPMYALYSGTKAFVDYFSRSLHHEYSGKGITVTCQSPYFVATKLAKIRHASLFAPSPSTYAKAAVAAIGDGDSTVPYWAHWLQDSVVRSLPAWLLHSQLMSMHLGLRKKYLKKLESDKKA